MYLEKEWAAEDNDKKDSCIKRSQPVGQGYFAQDAELAKWQM
jgi:hypothetical protein